MKSSAPARHPIRSCLGGLLAGALLLQAALSFADTVRYTYDTAGRLTSAAHGDGRTIYYTYDPAGNILARKIVVITDSDNDGMEDQWELDSFETLGRDGSGDFDDDGLTDLDEYLAGTNPDDPASTLVLLQVERSSELPITESLSISNDTAILEWNSVEGESYKVQYKQSLAQTNWADLAPEFVAEGAQSGVEDAGLDPERFYRVVQTSAGSGSYATVSWSAVPGKTYRVQFKRSLDDPFWTDLVGDVTAVLEVASRSDVTPEAASRFYRVMLLP